MAKMLSDIWARGNWVEVRDVVPPRSLQHCRQCCWKAAIKCCICKLNEMLENEKDEIYGNNSRPKEIQYMSVILKKVGKLFRCVLCRILFQLRSFYIRAGSPGFCDSRWRETFPLCSSSWIEIVIKTSHTVFLKVFFYFELAWKQV